MRKNNWKAYLFWIGLSLGVGALAGLLSSGSMEVYRTTVLKPPLSPPGWVFPVVWTVLYILMGISAARIWMLKPSKLRSKGINLFVAQLVVNFFWSMIFFNLGAYALAFLWLLLLWGLVFWMIITFRQLDTTAARLQLPYLLWLTFAAYLSGGVWLLNGGVWLLNG